MLLPGNVGESKSSVQSSNVNDADCAFVGRKNGRREMYADARESMGNTRSVPSPGPVLESDVQPCHARNMEQAFLY
jgi:hypothetical protein